MQVRTSSGQRRGSERTSHRLLRQYQGKSTALLSFTHCFVSINYRRIYILWLLYFADFLVMQTLLPSNECVVGQCQGLANQRLYVVSF